MPRILIVDDEADFREPMVEWLRLAKWDAVGAKDGQEGIELLARESFDGVILDRSMSNQSGDEVLREVRKNPSLKHLCIVTLTGKGDTQNELDHTRFGVWKYLRKPKAPPELLQLLKGGVALYQSRIKRGDLLTAFDPEKLLEEIKAILRGTLNPDEAHIVFVSPDGLQLPGGQRLETKHEFIARILEGLAFVWTNEPGEVKTLQPISCSTQSLMAVPVLTENRRIEGVLAMESDRPGAFEEWWRDILDEFAHVIGLSTLIARRAEAMKVQQQKVRDMELLYRELRHSLATHSQIVSGQTKELVDNADASVRKKAEIIQRNADAIEEVVEHLRPVSLKSPPLRLQRIRIDSLIREAAEAFQKKFKDEMIGVAGLDGMPEIEVSADEKWLGYVLKSIFENAIEAIEEGRRQDFNYREENERPMVAGQIGVALVPANGQIKLVISDNGIGFESENRELLFSPLYSTKSAGLAGERRLEFGLKRWRTVLGSLAKRIETEIPAGRIEGKTGLTLTVEDGKDERQAHIRILETHVEAAETLWEGDFKNILPPLVVDPERGIGLFTARRVVGELNGTIEATSPGLLRGACFEITLPKLP
jgi:CheY-like chemotaxis protein